MKQSILLLSLVLSSAALAGETASAAYAAPPVGNVETNVSTTLKKAGDDLDNSMKTLSTNVKKEISGAANKATQSTKPGAASPAGQVEKNVSTTLKTTGDNLDKSMKNFSNNVRKEISVSTNSTNKSPEHNLGGKPGSATTAGDVGKNVSATLKKAGDNLDNSMKTLSTNVHKQMSGSSSTTKSGQKPDFSMQKVEQNLNKTGQQLDSSMQSFSTNVKKTIEQKSQPKSEPKQKSNATSSKN